MPTIYNKVTLDNDTLMDISDTTAVASDVAPGKYFYLASGEKAVGAASSGSGSSGYTRTVIVPQQTITPTSYSNPNTGGTYYHASLTHLDGLEEGADYIITYNNNEYDSTCVIMYSTNYVLGSIHYFFGSSGTYPFGIICDNNTDEFEFAIDSASQVTIKIEKLNLLNSGTLLSNKSIAANGTYNASTDNLDGYSSVTVNVPTTVPNLQGKTGINPTTSSQTITADSGYDGLSSVQINAMPSGSATTPATTITANPSISVSSSGLITATASASQSITPTVSAGYVPTGTAGTVTVSGSNTQQLTALGATTYNTSTTDQTIASGTYLTGTQTIKAVTVSGLDASKILSGTTVMVGDANDADRIASVTGAVTFSTITTSSSNPSGGSNGDIWIKTS